MILRFLSGSVDAGELAEEQVARVAVHQRDVVVVAEQAHDLLGLARAQQPVIDEDAGELVADRLVDQHRGDGGIDAAGQAADHAPLADLGADARDRLRRGRRPWSSRRCSPRPSCVKLRSSSRAVRRVHDLGVELHAVEVRARRRRWRRRARRRWSPTTRKPGGSAVTRSPWLIQTCSRLALAPDAVEQRAVAGHARSTARPNSRWSRALDRAAELRAHGLLAVADAEHRHAQLEDAAAARAACRAWRHRGRAAGEDDGLRREGLRCGSGAALKGRISQ